jgi:hypothetical protein
VIQNVRRLKKGLFEGFTAASVTGNWVKHRTAIALGVIGIAVVGRFAIVSTIPNHGAESTASIKYFRLVSYQKRRRLRTLSLQ